MSRHYFRHPVGARSPNIPHDTPLRESGRGVLAAKDDFGQLCERRHAGAAQIAARAFCLSVVATFVACGESRDLTAPFSDQTVLARSEDLVRQPIDLPFYARVEHPYIAPHTDEWAAIVFYRPPSCIPPDFNLLDFFDIPGAFFCGSHTVEGFE